MFESTMSGWAEVSPHADTAQNNGETVMYVARDDKVVGYIGVQDEIRDVTKDALAELDKLDPPIRKVMLTGDNQQAAERVAAKVTGIDEVRAGLMPEEKLRAIEELRDSGGATAMVGDGINDAPALMQADVGIAMGGGTDIAIESADIIILSNRLNALPEAREISSRSYRKMVQNVTLAFLFNGIGIPIAATGLIYPVWAMVAMAVSVTAIFFNSLWGTPRLFFDAIRSVGQPIVNAPARQSA